MKKHIISVLLILSLSITATMASAGPIKKAVGVFALAKAAKFAAKKAMRNKSALRDKRIALTKKALLLRNQQRVRKIKKRPKRQKANMAKFLSGFKSSRFYINGENIFLDKAGMKHILERHHLKFRKGKPTDAQSFFPKNTSVSEIRSLIYKALQQEKGEVARIARSKGRIGNIVTRINGVKYQLGINNGRVATFFRPVVGK